MRSSSEALRSNATGQWSNGCGQPSKWSKFRLQTTPVKGQRSKVKGQNGHTCRTKEERQTHRVDMTKL
eukprot:649509-Rhodomonas_salina.2